MISHHHLQRTELREARHQSNSLEYAMAKGVATSPDMADLTTGGGRVRPRARLGCSRTRPASHKRRIMEKRRKEGGADA